MLKKLAKELLPPVIYRTLRGGGGGNVYRNGYANWAEAVAGSEGYDAKLILEKVLAATLEVKHGNAAFERDSVLFDHIEYAWPVTASLMWAAAQRGGSLSVLDFGGSLGSSYFQHRKFLGRLGNVAWHVVEQTHFVEMGRKHIEDAQLHFFNTIEEAGKASPPDVILLSSVLQYLESPYDLLKELARTPAEILVIDRNPVSDKHEDQVLIQQVPETIYSASYPLRVFSRTGLIERLAPDWALLEDYESLGGTAVISGGGGEFEYRGMTLTRQQA